MPGLIHRLRGREDARARVGLLRGMYCKVSGDENKDELWDGGSEEDWYSHSKSSPRTLYSRWQRSLPSHLAVELLLYIGIYYVILGITRFGLSDEHQEQFKDFSRYISKNLKGLGRDLTFLLGFYVKQIVNRWWNTWKAVPWPDLFPLVTQALVDPATTKARQWTGRLTRYCLLSYVLCLRRLSKALRRMFPSDQSLTDCGLASSKELSYLRSEGDLGQVWFVPLSWAMTMVRRSKQEAVMETNQKILIGGLAKFQDGLQGVDAFDHAIFPPVYRQVVNTAVYTYFILCLVGEQVEDPDILPHFPGFLILKFVFFFGWLEVAEAIQNPWGTDQDDFQVCPLVSRHLWALGRGLRQRGPPAQEEEEEEEGTPHEEELVVVDIQSGSSKYTK